MFREFTDSLVSVKFRIERRERDDLSDNKIFVGEGIGYLFQDFNFTREDSGYTKANNTNLYLDNVVYQQDISKRLRAGDIVFIAFQNFIWEFELKEVKHSMSKVGMNFITLKLSFRSDLGDTDATNC